jgi:hypothetical protein
MFTQYPGIIEVGCWAHARRYFKEAMPTAAVTCAQALALIGQLYRIERAASDRQLDRIAYQLRRNGRPVDLYRAGRDGVYGHEHSSQDFQMQISSEVVLEGFPT